MDSSIRSTGPAAGPHPDFQCAHCGRKVHVAPPGTKHRNHCPWCLWSRHVDDRPGDRAAYCGGRMEPIAVCVRRGGEWALVHRCKECGTLHANRIAGDDNAMALLSLAVRPLAQPPFPLDRLDSWDDRGEPDKASGLGQEDATPRATGGWCSRAPRDAPGPGRG